MSVSDEGRNQDSDVSTIGTFDVPQKGKTIVIDAPDGDVYFNNEKGVNCVSHCITCGTEIHPVEKPPLGERISRNNFRRVSYNNLQHGDPGYCSCKHLLCFDKTKQPEQWIPKKTFDKRQERKRKKEEINRHATIQVGAFKEKRNAQNLLEKLKAARIDSSYLDNKTNPDWFRVRIGPLSRDEKEATLKTLDEIGHKDIWVIES